MALKVGDLVSFSYNFYKPEPLFIRFQATDPDTSYKPMPFERKVFVRKVLKVEGDAVTVNFQKKKLTLLSSQVRLVY